MKAKRKVAGKDWEFDGTTITVRIPMTFDRRGGRKVIIAPDGGDAWAPAKPRPDEALIRALVRAHRWKRLLEEGKYRRRRCRSREVTRSFVNRLLRLTLLAPDIVEAILDGRQPKEMQLEDSDPGAAERLGRAAATPLREIGAGILGSEPRRHQLKAPSRTRLRPCVGRRRPRRSRDSIGRGAEPSGTPRSNAIRATC